MISILIPVFNKDINQLVHALSNQLSSLKTEGEILLIDDASDLSYKNVNQKVSALPFVTYRELNQNIGRNSIRQLLAKSARFEWLLFLDCDSQIINDKFLLAYQQAISGFHDVVIGGRQYVSHRPADCRLVLHWKYGTVREAVRPDTYHRKSYFGFMSNNFLIQKKVFDQIIFSDNLKDYGHEDTWIGMQLEKLKAKVTYINNPVLHNGLEDVDHFIEKSRSAVKNLKMLSSLVPVDILANHVKLFKYYMFVRKFGLSSLISSLYSSTELFINRNIHSCHPSLFLFDLYRLHLLIRFSKK